jgi:UDP-2,3-diacylglucosamine pyrophosphatase LpxH
MRLTPTEPTLILSDLHLGHRASRIKDPEQLTPLLRCSASIIFNGDTAEMRHENDRPIGRKLVAELARICHREGKKAFFVNGNHDPAVSHINHLDLHQGTVLVTHGDILFLDVAPWSRVAKHYRTKHREILENLGPEDFTDFEKRLLANKRTAIELQMIEPALTDDRLPALKLIIRQFWPPFRPFMIVKAWLDTPAKAANLARVFRPNARFIVVGHTHYPGWWKKEPRIIINTGGFVPYFGAYAAIIDAKRIELRRVDTYKRQFVLGKRLASYTIDPLRPAEGF